MRRFSHGILAVIVAAVALIPVAFSTPAQARDNDRDHDTTRNYQQYNHDRGRHNGYAYGQYNRNYRGNGYYRRNESAPFGYIGAADQRRYGYAYGTTSRRHHRRRHHS